MGGYYSGSESNRVLFCGMSLCGSRQGQMAAFVNTEIKVQVPKGRRICWQEI